MNLFGVPPCAKVLFILKKGCNTLIDQCKDPKLFCFHLCTYLSLYHDYNFTLYIARLIEGIFISKQSTVLQYSFNTLHCLKLLSEITSIKLEIDSRDVFYFLIVSVIYSTAPSIHVIFVEYLLGVASFCLCKISV